VFEPAAAALEAAVEAVAGRALVAIDPNCRPGAIPDAGAYRERMRRVIGRADLVKASDEDLGFLVEGAGPTDAARALLAGGGPAVVIVTRGRAGALVVTAEEAIEVAASPAIVVDTIGAGGRLRRRAAGVVAPRGHDPGGPAPPGARARGDRLRR
jgi:fructokinase